MLKHTGKLPCKLANTPIDHNYKLWPTNEDTRIDKEIYPRLVGRLIYLLHTRSDITYAVSMINQFMHNPKKVHL